MKNPLDLEDVITTTREILAQLLVMDAADVNEHSSIVEDLSADSLDIVDLSFQLGRHYGCTLPKTSVLDHAVAVFGDVSGLVEKGRNDAKGVAPRHIRSRQHRHKAGPFGAPIAHGFLTLSLLPVFFESAFDIRNTRMGVNYGLNRVRFTAPVPVGSRLRARLTLQAIEPIDQGGQQMTWGVVVEREGADKPVCFAESLVRQYP